jgi:hypothetical protein
MSPIARACPDFDARARSQGIKDPPNVRRRIHQRDCGGQHVRRFFGNPVPRAVDKLIIGKEAGENEQNDEGYFQRNPTTCGVEIPTPVIIPARPSRILHHLVGAAGGQAGGI